MTAVTIEYGGPSSVTTTACPFCGDAIEKYESIAEHITDECDDDSHRGWP